MSVKNENAMVGESAVVERHVTGVFTHPCLKKLILVQFPS